MKFKFIMILIATVMVGSAILVNAAPVPIGSALTGTGNGVNSKWVNTTYSPHNVDQAITALALTPGSSGYVAEVNQVVTAIDFADGNYAGEKTSGHSSSLLGTDNNFAVKYYGFLNITTADTYTFNAFTDDGFRLSIGGEQIMQYYGDRGPGTSTQSVSLGAGLYTFEMIGWEQGGSFVNELSWHNASTSTFTALNSDVLHTTATPVPAAVWLLGSGLVGLVGFKKRRAKK